eukprot:193623_1
MEELIQFQNLIRSLTDDEFISFCLALDRSLFITILFNYLKNEMQHDENKSQYPYAMNATLKNILNQRTMETHHQKINVDHALFLNHSEKTHLNHLSEDVIANIGSYLCLNSHINFSLCNQLIYISVRSKPMSISKMTLNSNQIQKYDNYVKTNPKSFMIKNRFKMIKSIELELNHYAITQFNTQLFPNIEKLHLHCEFEENDYENDKKPLQLLNGMNFSSLKELVIMNETFQPDISLILDNVNSNIEYIAFQVDFSLYDTDLEDYLSSLENIKGLCTHLCLIPKFVNRQQSKLESLHVLDGRRLNLINDHEEYYPIYVQLKELCIYYEPGYINKENTENNKYYDTYKTFTKCVMLKRVHISINTDIGDFTVDDILFFGELFSNQCVNFISIYQYKYFSCDVINILIKSLSKRNRLKIRFGCDGDNVVNETGKIIELIHNFAQYNAHFMFIFEFDLTLMDKLQSFLNDELIGKYLVNWLETTEYWWKRGRMIVSNIGCNICGYKERWLYRCHCCKYCL